MAIEKKTALKHLRIGMAKKGASNEETMKEVKSAKHFVKAYNASEARSKAKPTLMKRIGSGIKKALADREEDEYMKNKAKSEAIKSKMK